MIRTHDAAETMILGMWIKIEGSKPQIDWCRVDVDDVVPKSEPF
jgi:hypothetical protein